MTPDRWTRIKALFAEAADLPSADRAALLDREAVDAEGAPDPELRAAVEAMLAEDADGGTFFEGMTPPTAPAPGPPAEVGPWRLVERVGEGGMGEVWRAERADGAYAQTAAVKLVRPGLAPDLLARFRAERQILAGLDHPAIARLLDGGTASDGRPYLALEFVDGVPITDYADGRRLSVDARLALFRRVCEAVAAAHRRLVVHRDLKPSNVLVTDDGTVKLLDFGIAKLLDPDGADVPVTAAERRVMTPEYAAPEQVRGEPATTATDVYGLGVLLYELLTGTRPYRMESRVRRAVEQAILEADPTEPSTAVTGADAAAAARSTEPPKLRRRLRGDLDQIVLKALRKEPERRYDGAAALAADLGRHLDGLPVEARPESVRYRVGKFVRRHRAPVAAAALALVAVLGGAGAALWQASEARAAQARAEAEAATAEQVTGVLGDVFTAADPLGAEGPEVPAGRLLENGIAGVRESLADQPEVLARLLAAAGQVETGWGRSERAVELLEEARALADSAEGAEGTRLRVRGLLGNAYTDLSRLDDAERELRAVYDAERVRRSGSLALATAANDLSRVVQRQGDLDAAEALLREAVDLRRAAGDASSDFAGNLNNLAGLLADKGDAAAAIPLYREAAALVEAELGPDHPYVAFALSGLGTALENDGQYAEALEVTDRALAIGTAALGEAHPFVPSVVDNRAAALLGLGRTADAVAAYERGLTLRRAALPEGHPEVAFSLVGLGVALVEDGQAARAVPLLREAVAVREAGYESPHWLTAIARGRLAEALAADGLPDAARAARAAALREGRAALGPDAEPVRAMEERLAALRLGA